MITFIEVANQNGDKFLMNLSQIQAISPVIGRSDQCVVRFASGSLKDIIINEDYDEIMKRIFKLSV